MSPRIEPGLTSVVVVTANSGPLTMRCVEGVLASRADVELLVIDNASQDGQIEAIETRFGSDARVRILRNARNIGFGPACNRAALEARGDALLILNPDCLIGPDVVAGLGETARRYPDAGIIGVSVTDAAGVIEPASRRRDPTLRRALSSLSGFAQAAGRWSALEGVDMAAACSTQPERVDAISGACIYVPRSVFAQLGGFDERYFLHCEDLDLCRRARDAGYAVLHAPGIRVCHEQGSSSFHRPLFVSRHKHRSMWRYFRSFDPAARNPIASGLVWIGIWTHFAMLAPWHAWRQWIRAGIRDS